LSQRPDPAWKNEFNDRVKAFVLRGDYKRAVAFAKDGLRQYPQEFVCRFQYAKVLGDYADELPLKQKKKLKNEAIRILKPLLRSLRGIPADQRFSVCLNYYYQTESFKKMSRFGQRFQKTDKQRGIYAQALGATLVAFELHENGRSSRAWAQKAKSSWARYNLKSEKYYFPHYNYAKALALLGEKKSAMSHLKTAARLSKRPITDWEFADVMKLI